MLKRCLFVGLSLLLGVLGGCGGSGHSVTPPDGSTQDFGALAGTYLTHLAADPATAGQRTADDLAARPDVKESGVMPDGTPYAVFDDNTVWAFANNRTPSTTPLAPAGSRVGVGGVPNGKKVAVFNTLVDSGWSQAAAPTVTNLLKDAGYSVHGGTTLIGTLEHWESLTDITFLYADAHGLSFKSGGTELFALVTATEATPALLASRAQDFADQKLIIVSTVRHDGSPTLTPINRVALTQRWFSSRNFLAASSHVFLNACWSGLMTFREIGNPVRAGLVLKWNGVVSDLFAGQFALNYFEKMLNPENPRQNWLEVYNELGSAGRRDPVTGLEISFNQGQGSFDQFLPEITSIQLAPIGVNAEPNDILTIGGIFGEVPGVVLDDSAGGTPLQLISWSKGSVTARLNLNTTRIKIQANGRETNSVALPYWKLSAPNGGAFYLSSYMFANLGRQVVQTISNRLAGPAGPFWFEAAPGDFVSVGLHCDVNGTGGNDEMVVTSPDGRVTSIIPAMSGRSWDRDLGAKEYFRLQRVELDPIR